MIYNSSLGLLASQIDPSENKMPLPEQILASCAERLADGGYKAASMRSIAGDIGVTSATIHYHFSSRQDLYVATFNKGCEAERQWYQSVLAAIDGLALTPAHFADWFVYVIIDKGLRRRRQSMLERELFLQVDRHPYLLPVAKQWAKESKDFISAALTCFGIDAKLAELVEDLLCRAVDFFPAGTDDYVQAAWCGQVVRYFAARLTGERPVGDVNWRDVLEEIVQDKTVGFLNIKALAEAPPGTLSTSEKLLDAAIRVIVRDGDGGLTHRALAKEAGVSLSATTHYFDSRETILRLAFERLYSRFAGAGKFVVERKVGDIGNVFERLGRSFINEHGDISPDIIATDELYVAAMRDPVLSPFALDLLTARGKNSLYALQAMTPDDMAVSKTDGWLWSFSAMGTVLALRMIPKEERLDVLINRIRFRYQVFYTDNK